MGSRFGGLKQVCKFGDAKKSMLDLALEDALECDFSKAVFVIRKDIEKIFREEFSKKYEDKLDVRYVFQEISGAPLPSGRSKPWGTGHAVLSCANEVSEPFIAINADDYYGRGVFEDMSNFLKNSSPKIYALAGYRLKNTLSENGGVSRGVCKTDADSNLVSISEIGEIRESSDGAIRGENDASFNGDEFVSMNFWGFPAEFMGVLGADFEEFLKKNSQDPKAEFYLLSSVDKAVKTKSAKVKVLPTNEKWQGITYKEDFEKTEEFLRKQKRI